MTQAASRKPSRRARYRHAQQELSTAEAFHLIDETAAIRVPLLALTGGDPLIRPDLLPIVHYASRHSLRTSLTLPTTPHLTRDAIFELKQAGLMRLALWLDCPGAVPHDRSRLSGSRRHTLEAAEWCKEAGLPLQINTTITRRNFGDFGPMLDLLLRLNVVLWNVFLFSPAIEPGDALTAEDYERVFARLYAASRRVRFQIKVTEGQHYQRYVLQQRAGESAPSPGDGNVHSHPIARVNDTKGSVFVNSAGEVFPSQFLPLSGGNVTQSTLREIYAESPLFVLLRDSSKLRGKCGICSFRNVCGGSRARAYALTGDVLAADPGCTYQPAEA